MKFLETSTEELNQKKMVILIPFLLLKLRNLMKKKRSSKNLEKLKKLITNDIIGSIEENLRVGNITYDDAHILKRLTNMLYVLEEHERISNKLNNELAEKNSEIAAKDKKNAELESLLAKAQNK